ncbi:MAG: HAMP domain-containing histidine kinase [Burkholderiales bacterium]|nr:HAMP domain-containing histidine kinase [Burkholderiales bacterium]MDR4517769.1 HAMP domain-containing histidine kinase [Nitrosomonas sp.]
MGTDYRQISNETISNANAINNKLIEKSLAMRCISYLSHVKAQLLTNTIFEIDHSKKNLFNINSKLEQEIKIRKQTEKKLQKAKDEAEDATKLKDKFVTLVSHDLKTPLNGIMGYIELVKLNTQLPDNANRMLDAALSACHDMNALINEMLNLSRIKSGKINLGLEFINVHEMINSIVEQYAPMANNKGIVLTNEINEPTQIYADKKLLTEVFNNLISNAIKFCNQGDSITIHMPEGDDSIIAVTDTGIGIHPEAIDNLFSYDIKTSTTGTAGESGTGFGLPLAHEIIQAHKGTLQVNSILGKGTTFHVRLPKRNHC